jgi:hypothetical protein
MLSDREGDDMNKCVPALLAILALTPLPACQTLPTPADVVSLKSRTIVITKEEISPAFLTALNTTDLSRLHAFVQLRRQPDAEIQRTLEASGLRLLFHVTPHVWVCSVTKAFVPEDATAQRYVRWLGEIRPADKVAPELRENRFYKWAIQQDGRIKLSVEFFSDTPRSEAEMIVKRYTNEIQPWATGHGWYLLAPKEAIQPLSEYDQIKWIDQGPLPLFPLNNFTRAAIHADETQELDLSAGAPVYHGLTGAGVRVGVWDTGMDATHEDFLLHDAAGAVTGSRIFTGGSSPDPHGTAVAGVLGASGYRSAPCGTLSYLFRGMAPEVEFLAWFPHPRWGPALINFAESINTLSMDASNHSYVQETDGRYLSTAQQMDQLVRGTASSGGAPIPPRPMVWAAGNNGRTPAYSSVEGYFSVEAAAKNPISVGATMANVAGALNHLADFSSLGPTWDGRIKPDVVAPGDAIRTTRAGTNCYTIGESGTSVAAPAVAGTLALMLQQYARTYGVDLDTAPPLPSTLKAALIQTATDLADAASDPHDWVNPDTGADVRYHVGPDYATGYGLVNALAAVGIVKEKKLLENTIAARGEVNNYEFRVAPGTDRIQFTLAWDDEAYEGIYAPDTDSRLVNDLELSLIAPDGTEHLPWVLASLTPAATRGDPDPIAPADITPATRGRDHRNNIEQVTVASPAHGLWTARVQLAAGSPGTLTQPQPYSLAGDFDSRVYFADWQESPGSVYEIRDGAPQVLHTAASGRVYHSAFGMDGTLYYSDANDTALYRLRPDGASEVFHRHTTYVRDVGIDPTTGWVYFSEASGARAAGVIYRYNPVMGRVAAFYRVQLSEVHGFWAGDFAFDGTGRLYLASGNRIGGRIYRVDSPAMGSPPVEVYSLPGEAITGIAFNRRSELFFTNWDSAHGNIHRLSLTDGRRDLVYSFPNRRIWDVSFRW